MVLNKMFQKLEKKGFTHSNSEWVSLYGVDEKTRTQMGLGTEMGSLL